MKKIILAICLAVLSISAYTQAGIPVNPETKKYSYSEVVSLSDVVSKDLFKRAVNWYETKYKTQNFDLKNEEEGKIAHKGQFTTLTKVLNFMIETTCFYTISVSVKDGKYRYEFTDFVLSSNNSGTENTMTLESYANVKGQKGVKEERFQKIDEQIKKDVETLKKYMSGDKSANGDDW